MYCTYKQCKCKYDKYRKLSHIELDRRVDGGKHDGELRSSIDTWVVVAFTAFKGRRGDGFVTLWMGRIMEDGCLRDELWVSAKARVGWGRGEYDDGETEGSTCSLAS